MPNIDAKRDINTKYVHLSPGKINKLITINIRHSKLFKNSLAISTFQCKYHMEFLDVSARFVVKESVIEKAAASYFLTMSVSNSVLLLSMIVDITY